MKLILLGEGRTILYSSWRSPRTPPLSNHKAAAYGNGYHFADWFQKREGENRGRASTVLAFGRE
jgi:hypothetical protein